MKKILVKNWKSLHKSFTVILSVLASLFGLLEVVLPHMGILQPMLDPATYGIIMFCMTVAIGLGRYINQEALSKAESSAREKDID